ncbi:MAG: hypothetical protein IPM54_24315 [Polyangiaceae bacterium]|nr:hypothetical protein [Polyangiaceae bacterium]
MGYDASFIASKVKQAKCCIIDAFGSVVTYAHDTEEHLVGIVNERGEEYRFTILILPVELFVNGGSDGAKGRVSPRRCRKMLREGRRGTATDEIRSSRLLDA